MVGEYEGRPLSGLWTHHRRPKAGPAIQSSRRERNPKGSRWLLCARAELCAAAGIWSEDWALCEAIVASDLRCSDAGFGGEKLASGREKRHFMRELCSDARFGGWKACVAEDGGERFLVRLEMTEGWLETRGPRAGLG